MVRLYDSCSGAPGDDNGRVILCFAKRGKETRSNDGRFVMAEFRKVIPLPVSAQTIGVHNQKIRGSPRMLAANGRRSVHANNAAANNRAETLGAANEPNFDVADIGKSEFVVAKIEARQ